MCIMLRNVYFSVFVGKSLVWRTPMSHPLMDKATKPMTVTMSKLDSESTAVVVEQREDQYPCPVIS